MLAAYQGGNMSDENNNNGTALVVLGLLGFLAIIITGKFILDNNNRKECGPECHEGRVIINRSHHDREGYRPRVIGPRVELNTPPARPYTPCPEYHNKSEFWFGYNDGWAGVSARMRCPEYLRGYEIGLYDRRMNRKDYFNRYYPPGFHIRVPGFHLDIR